MKTFSISQRKKARGNLTWYGKINDGERVSFISLKTERRTEALEWLATQNAQRFLPESMRIEKKDHSLNDALRQYMVMVETSKGAGSNTFLAYDSRLGHLKNGLQTIRLLQFGSLGLNKRAVSREKLHLG